MTTPHIVPDPKPLVAQHTGGSERSMKSGTSGHQAPVLSRRSSVINAQIDTHTIGTPAPAQEGRPRMHKRSLTGKSCNCSERETANEGQILTLLNRGNYYPNGETPDQSTWPIGDEKVWWLDPSDVMSLICNLIPKSTLCRSVTSRLGKMPSLPMRKRMLKA